MAGRERLGNGDDPVHQGLGIAGSDPVVAFEVRAERLRDVSDVMRIT